MNYDTFIIKYAEIGTKGKNRYVFEDMLVKHIRRRLKSIGNFDAWREYGRIYVKANSDYDYRDAMDRLTKIFGIVGVCPVCVVKELDIKAIGAGCVEYLKDEYGEGAHTFKIRARRNNKAFPVSSQDINMTVGGDVLDALPAYSVDVHTPEIMVDIEVRNEVYIYSKVIPGPGGLPVGTNGRGIALLSGGIDSPVSAYMIAKRGVEIEAVYFNAPPYTSERAKKKVIDLGSIVAQYAGPIRLHIINFTDVQLCIYENCPHDELTIIMKRCMYRIAEEIGLKNDCQLIVTGESIGQVSSQTAQSLYVIDHAISELPVMRPCIGMDKQEIVDRSLEIGSYETSVLPYEDCCTIFVDKHPVTKPKLFKIEESEEKLVGKIEDLIRKAVETEETVICR